jgi:transposase-like protein
VNQETIKGVLAKHVAEGSTVYHDEAGAYTYINDKYISDKVMHSRGEYVRGQVHTNTIEGYWNILRKQIDGIHHSVSPKHLHRYCCESAF